MTGRRNYGYYEFVHKHTSKMGTKDFRNDEIVTLYYVYSKINTRE